MKDTKDTKVDGLDELCINTIRFLSVDMVQAANSGHPGAPMGAAPMAYLLWTRHLRHNPADPAWPDRDRFVLSAGHASALLYSLLHLTGYDLSLEDLTRFRSFGSRTPGHPERHLTPGVEASTGPLGQGVGNAVGMAIAEAHLAARYNRPGHDVVNHRTWVLASDGDIMEGVQSEAASLAGELELGKLIVLYDANQITLSSTTDLTFTEDVAGRYRAYGWHVQTVEDGNDLRAIEEAMKAAIRKSDAPSLIIVRTVIGFGAPHLAGTFKAHGSPLGEAETTAAKRALDWPLAPPFFIPARALAHFRQTLVHGKQIEEAWSRRRSGYERAFPKESAELERRSHRRLPKDWDAGLPTFSADAKGMATRKAGEAVMQAIASSLPELMGGSGDLDPSTYTWLKEQGDFEPPARPPDQSQGTVGGPWSYAGRNIHFGVREHAMGAIVNGLAYHDGLVPFGATFLVFHDYMRPPVRLSAIARLGSIWIYTHDSIGVGEDGPTHQPVEQLAALRAIPNLLVIRPADANETRWAWTVAVENRLRPTALILTRQAVPTLDRDNGGTGFAPAENLRRGAYVLDCTEASNEPDLILIATGSEVQLIVEAAPLIATHGVKVRLVSMPSWELFEEQDEAYRQSVLPSAVTARLSVEAASPMGWQKWVGDEGDVLAVDRFGASAPGEVVLREYGFTVENVVRRALALLRRRGER